MGEYADMALDEAIDEWCEEFEPGEPDYSEDPLWFRLYMERMET